MTDPVPLVCLLPEAELAARREQVVSALRV